MHKKTLQAATYFTNIMHYILFNYRFAVASTQQKPNLPSPNKFIALQHPFPLQNGLEGRKIQAKGIIARTRRRQNDLLLFTVAGRRHRRFTLAHTGFHSNGSIVYLLHGMN